MNDIEKLFKEKLSHHSVAPPPELWDKLEQARAPQKKKGGWLWMVAASVLLLLLSGLFITNFRTTAPPEAVALEEPIERKIEEPAMESAPSVPDVSEKAAEQAEEVVPETRQTLLRKEKPEPSMLAQKEPAKTVKRPEPLAKLETVSSLKMDSAESVLTELPQNGLVAQVPTEKSYNLTIIYKSGQTKNEPKAEETRPLEKAATFLANIKENGVGFSELRSAKSEIFSKAFSNKRETMSAE